MLAKLLVSTTMADASPPKSRISRSTVLIVENGEFGFGGKAEPGL